MAGFYVFLNGFNNNFIIMGIKKIKISFELQEYGSLEDLAPEGKLGRRKEDWI